jgi:hypothetical protein
MLGDLTDLYWWEQEEAKATHGSRWYDSKDAGADQMVVVVDGRKPDGSALRLERKSLKDDWKRGWRDSWQNVYPKASPRLEEGFSEVWEEFVDLFEAYVFEQAPAIS